MKPENSDISQASLDERCSEGFARRRICSPSEQASLGHFLDWATRELGLCSFKVSALQNKLECFEKCFARLMGKFWGMTPISYNCHHMKMIPRETLL